MAGSILFECALYLAGYEYIVGQVVSEMYECDVGMNVWWLGISLLVVVEIAVCRNSGNVDQEQTCMLVVQLDIFSSLTSKV